jgi:hypothetical protein
MAPTRQERGCRKLECLRSAGNGRETILSPSGGPGEAHGRWRKGAPGSRAGDVLAVRVPGRRLVATCLEPSAGSTSTPSSGLHGLDGFTWNSRLATRWECGWPGRLDRLATAAVGSGGRGRLAARGAWLVREVRPQPQGPGFTGWTVSRETAGWRRGGPRRDHGAAGTKGPRGVRGGGLGGRGSAVRDERLGPPARPGVAEVLYAKLPVDMSAESGRWRRQSVVTNRLAPAAIERRVRAPRSWGRARFT